MKRVGIAWALLLFAIAVAGLGSWTVHDSFHRLDTQLINAEFFCSQQDYNKALEISQQANTDFSHREHLLALFLRRDDLRQLQSGLAALPSYASPEYENDFLFEINQTRAQLANIQHLFFSLL